MADRNRRRMRKSVLSKSLRLQVSNVTTPVFGLIALIAEGPTCFIFAARDIQHNSAVVLKAYLDALMAANKST